jgi:hypothetical protein
LPLISRSLATEAAPEKVKPEGDMFGLNRIMKPDTVDLNEKKVCDAQLVYPPHMDKMLLAILWSSYY